MSGTSQFKPLPEAERMICLRLTAIRKYEKMTQEEFAAKVGSTENQIANISALRVPLRAGLACSICLALKVNPGWLATGFGGPKYKANYLDFLVRKCSHPKALFSAYYRQFLENQIGRLSEKARANTKTLNELIVKRIEILPKLPETKEMDELVARDTQNIEKYLANLKADRSLRAEVRVLLEENNLTETETTDTKADVKLLLPNLLKRLNELTSEPGKKSELAKFLGAPLASVSRWLSGDREPGGEIALKMLYWAERQQPK